MSARRCHPRDSLRQRLETLESRCVLASLPFADAPIVHTLGPVEQVLVVGDFDGDGRDDIVASSRQSNLASAGQAGWYRLNSSTQRWEQAGTFPPHAANESFEPSAAVDMDRDQDLDLVIESSYVNIDKETKLKWMENSDGKGTFTTLHDMHAHGLDLSYVLADLDRDGDTDVGYTFLSAPSTLSMAWSENLPTGFAKHEISGTPRDLSDVLDTDNDGIRTIPVIAVTRRGPFSSDLDGDGDLDLIENFENVSRWSENTNGAAEWFVRGQQGAIFSYVLPQDIDGDGDIDLWSQTDRTVAWLENRGDWNFVRHEWNAFVDGPIFTADINGNGVESLFVLNPESHLIWYDADTRSNTLTPHVTEGRATEQAEAAVDFNGDGRTDLIGLQGWYERTASAHEFIMHDYPANVDADQVAVSDLDRDGRSDLVFVEVTRKGLGTTVWNLSWVRQDTDGLASPEPIGSFRGFVLSWQRDSQDLQVRDFDGDGLVDLLHLSHGQLTWFQQTGPLHFERRFLTNLPGKISSLNHLVDWDGDKDLDAVLFDSGNGLHIQDGGGNFTRSRLTLPILTDHLDLGDFDGDGDQDLAFLTNQNNATGVIGWIPFQKGTPRTAVQIAIYPTNQAATIHAADLNGDGDLDIVVQHGPRSDAMTIAADYDLRTRLFDNLNGTGSFAEAPESILNRGPLRLIADIDDDHLNDLVVSPQTVSGIVVLYNQPPRPFPSGDLDHDGKVTIADLGAFCWAFPSENPSGEWDINRDGHINEADHAYLVKNLLHLIYGDANFDGRFDSADVVFVAQQGTYETADKPSNWETGDWNCDGRFTSQDLIWALQESGYEL